MSKLTLKEFLVCDAILGDAPEAIEQTQVNDNPIDVDREFDQFIEEQFNIFFKFDTDDKNVVTIASCKLFTKHIVDLLCEKATDGK